MVDMLDPLFFCQSSRWTIFFQAKVWLYIWVNVDGTAFIRVYLSVFTYIYIVISLFTYYTLYILFFSLDILKIAPTIHEDFKAVSKTVTSGREETLCAMSSRRQEENVLGKSWERLEFNTKNKNPVEQWRKPWLFRVYEGWNPAQLCGDENKPWCKDSLLNSQHSGKSEGFFRGSGEYQTCSGRCFG